MTDDISAHPTMASRTPLRMSAYALDCRDMGKQVAFYQRAVGFDVQDRTSRTATLGVSGVPLLHLFQREGLAPDDSRQAGLHHLAFLMPTRADLADWYRHTRDIGLTITHTGDHHVNEALYFRDAEDNGCECYADRPESHWQWDADGKVYIPNVPVDLESLQRDERPESRNGSRTWAAPKGLRIGHINLRVGEIMQSEGFYCDLLGLDHTARREVMTFMSNGRYHHHMATNILQSKGAGQRKDGHSGMAWFAFEHDQRFDAGAVVARLKKAGVPVTSIDNGFEAPDPWGTRVRLVQVR